MMGLRAQVAANAGYPNYRDYRWQQLYRYDYTPDDAKRFHEAIAEVIVPAVTRLNARRRAATGRADAAPMGYGCRPDGEARAAPL